MLVVNEMFDYSKVSSQIMISLNFNGTMQVLGISISQIVLTLTVSVAILKSLNTLTETPFYVILITFLLLSLFCLPLAYVTYVVAVTSRFT